jgi:hypothetical protein
MSRVQTGYLYEASGAFFVRYYTGEALIVDGKEKRVQRSHRLHRIWCRIRAEMPEVEVAESTIVG